MEDLYYYSYTADIPDTTATATLGAMLGTYSAIVIAFYVYLLLLNGRFSQRLEKLDGSH